MKKLLIVLVLLCFAGKATLRTFPYFEKDVKWAKHVYINEPFPALRALDSLTWRGLKAIRHDQKFWIRKR